jgi:hypothetical protein
MISRSGRLGLWVGRDPGGTTGEHALFSATCPVGVTVVISPKGHATFGAKCKHSGLHHCTTSKAGMHLSIHRRHADELGEAPARDGLDDYRKRRPVVEHSIAWLVARGNRRVRFRGVEKNQLGLSLRQAALNFRRIVNLGLDNNGKWLPRTHVVPSAQIRVVKKGPHLGHSFNPLPCWRFGFGHIQDFLS